MFTSELFRFLAAEEQPRDPLLFPPLADSNEILVVIEWPLHLLIYTVGIFILCISLMTHTQSGRYVA